MLLSKSMFGGYKRKLVDEVIQRMTENEEHLAAKISVLENEFRLSKENSQRSLEGLQTELAMRQKSLVDLARSLEEKSNMLSNIEQELMDKNQNSEEKIKSSVLSVETYYQQKINDIETKYKEKLDKFNQNEDQLKKIGQIYVEAHDNAQKIKQESKVLLSDSVSQIFKDLYFAKDNYEASNSHITQKKKNLMLLTDEISDTLKALQNKLDRLEQEQVNLPSPFVTLKETEDRILIKIDNLYGLSEKREISNENKEDFLGKKEIIEKQKEDFLDLYERRISKIEEETKKTTESLRCQQLSEKAFYEKQISELLDRLNEQKDTINSLNISKPSPVVFSKSPQNIDGKNNNENSENNEKNNNEINNNENDYDNNSFDKSYFSNRALNNEDNESELLNSNQKSILIENRKSELNLDEDTSEIDLAKEKPVENTSRYEREREEREAYSKYFEEISKKYCKEMPNPYPPISMQNKELFGDSNTPCDEQHLVEIVSNKPLDAISKNSLESDDLTENKNEEASLLPNKKPSIKDILNKYSNMK